MDGCSADLPDDVQILDVHMPDKFAKAVLFQQILYGLRMTAGHQGHFKRGSFFTLVLAFGTQTLQEPGTDLCRAGGLRRLRLRRVQKLVGSCKYLVRDNSHIEWNPVKLIGQRQALPHAIGILPNQAHVRGVLSQHLGVQVNHALHFHLQRGFESSNVLDKLQFVNGRNKLAVRIL